MLGVPRISIFACNEADGLLEIETQSQYENRPKIASLSCLHFTLVLTTLAVTGHAEETAASVKSYLLKKLEKINAASEDFVKNSEAYSALVAANGGSVEAAYKADPKQMEKLGGQDAGELQGDGQLRI